VSDRQVGVRAAVSGTVAPGYWIESLTVDPSSVAVVGDPKVLANINYLDSAPLNVNGATSSIAQELRIVTPAGISPVQQQTVMVRAAIAPLQSTQSIRIAPRVINLDPRLQVTGVPDFVDVVVEGPAPTMRDLRIDAVGVTLNASDLGEGSFTLRPSVSTPPGVSVVTVEPTSVRLILFPRPTAVPTPTAAPTPTPAPVPTVVNPDSTPPPVSTLPPLIPPSTPGSAG
jgi:YbbR domain-containing protein